MSKKNHNNFLVQGSILAMAGIVSRIIGLLYRIPMLNIIGEKGMGVYSTAYSIYSIVLFISCYSLPMAVSKLVSARLGMKEYRNIHRIFLVATIFGTALGVIAALIMVKGAHFFAVTVMKMPEAEMAIKALGPAILIMGLLGVMRGFFQGYGTMVPTAVSQILEQVLHVAISLLAGAALYSKGQKMDASGANYYASAYGATGATIGTAAGAFAALLFLILVFMLFRRIYGKKLHHDHTTTLIPYKEVLVMLVMTSFPILLSATMSNISNIIDQALYGQYMGADYASFWGVYTSKYVLLVNVPVAISSALSASTLPLVSSLNQQKKKKEALERSAQAIRFINLIAMPAAVGLGVLGKPCFDLLFRSTNNVLAGRMMTYGFLAVLLISLSNVIVGILQGFEMFWQPILSYFLAIVIHMPIIWLLLWVMNKGILGVVVSHIAYLLIACILNLLFLSRKTGYRQEWRYSFIYPGLCSIVMGAVALAAYKFLYAVKLGNTLSLILAIGIAMLSYFVLIIKTGVVDGDTLQKLPYGRRIYALAVKLRLIRQE